MVRQNFTEVTGITSARFEFLCETGILSGIKDEILSGDKSS